MTRSFRGWGLLAAVAMVAASVPTTGAAEDDALGRMRAEIDAVTAAVRAGNADFLGGLREAGLELPAEAFAAPVASVAEAQGRTRAMVVYGTPAEEYADFVVALYRFYVERGALGVEALRALTGEQLADLVARGVLPSHEAYQKFNLLGFYASLRDPANEQWLLDQPKTNPRAQERIVEVLEGVSPAMREDAGRLLGQAMAAAYLDILALEPSLAAVRTGLADAPLPPPPPLPPVQVKNGPQPPTVEDARASVRSAEAMAAEQAKYVLEQVVPVATDVKLTALSELTLVLNQLTSLKEVFRSLETYYYEYNYYYHYEFLQHFWWMWEYRVDHIEQVDRVAYERFTEDTYELLEYVYQYQDLMNIRGLVSGVLALEYEKAVTPSLKPVAGVVDAVEAPPEEVQVLLDYVMPFTFDIVDELSLYYVQEMVNHVLTFVKNEFHYYWEYHIRNYWYWDPLNSEDLPFADAALSGATEYLVSVKEDLQVGKVLNVIPVGTMYREASVRLVAPAQEYPLLDRAAALEPAPVAFLVGQAEPGATARKVEQQFHVGPAPNAAELHLTPARLGDALVGAADTEQARLLAAYGAAGDALGQAYGQPTTLYSLLPRKVQVDPPALDPKAPAAALPERVDPGVDADQVLSWETAALPGFIPQFAFVGVRALDAADGGRPIGVDVNARGLGAPVHFTVDLNRALRERAGEAVDDARAGEVPVVGLDAVGQALPGAAPLAAWAEQYRAQLAAWTAGRL